MIRMKTVKTSGAIRNAALAVLFVSLIICIAIIRPAVEAAPPLPGAIFTTDSTCSGVDLNIYSNKSDVYLNGGPAHPGAASLPDGSYYVRVTDPSGSLLLGTSIGSGNDTPFVVSGGVVQGCYQLCGILISGGNPDPNCGYDDTNNPGGEYKVWVSTVSTFDNNSTKTDNFKVKADPPPPVTLCIDKFYDANVNGIKDTGEVSINGWPFQVFADDNLYISRESYFRSVVDVGSYRVVESDPLETNWLHTTNPVVYVTLPPDANLQFGNVCMGAGGGLTLGFWSNKNGQAILAAHDTAWRTLLNGLNLRDGNGNLFLVPSGSFSSAYGAFRSWLLSANATNMAYMLSAQLAAMELNVAYGNVSGGSLVFAGANPAGCSVPVSGTGFITINALMQDAANELAANGFTTAASDPVERICQNF